MISPKLFLLSQFAAFWPVWRWYLQRMLDGSDEPWGILACVTVLLVLLRKGAWNAPGTLTIRLCSALTVLYILSYPLTPPLLRAVLAVMMLSLSLSSMVTTQRNSSG